MDNNIEYDILFATGGYDNSINMWQPSTGICSKTFQHSESQVIHGLSLNINLNSFIQI